MKTVIALSVLLGCMQLHAAPSHHNHNSRHEVVSRHGSSHHADAWRPSLHRLGDAAAREANELNRTVGRHLAHPQDDVAELRALLAVRGLANHVLELNNQLHCPTLSARSLKLLVDDACELSDRASDRIRGLRHDNRRLRAELDRDVNQLHQALHAIECSLDDAIRREQHAHHDRHHDHGHDRHAQVRRTVQVPHVFSRRGISWSIAFRD